MLKLRLHLYLLDDFDQSLHLLSLIFKLIIIIGNLALINLQLLPIGCMLEILLRYFHEPVAKQQDDEEQAKHEGQANDAADHPITTRFIFFPYFYRAFLPESVKAKTMTMIMKVTK